MSDDTESNNSLGKAFRNFVGTRSNDEDKGSKKKKKGEEKKKQKKEEKKVRKDEEQKVGNEDEEDRKSIPTGSTGTSSARASGNDQMDSEVNLNSGKTSGYVSNDVNNMSGGGTSASTTTSLNDQTDSKSNRNTGRKTVSTGTNNGTSNTSIGNWTDSNDNPDIKFFMEKLQHAAKSGFEEVQHVSHWIKSNLPSLKLAKDIDFSSTENDCFSQQLLPTNQLKSEYSALKTTGDGNCLFRAASILACGDEERHDEMRVRAVVELACNSQFYLDDRDISARIQVQEQLIYACNGKAISRGKVNMKDVSAIFQAEVVDICKRSTFASYWQLQALGTVFDRQVRSVLPQCGSEDIRKYFDAVIFPREFNPESEPLVIMWTTTKDCNTSEFLPNHFVPLIPANKSSSFRDEPANGGPCPPHNFAKSVAPSCIRDENRRSSLPSCFPNEEEPAKIPHHISEPSLTQVKKEKQLKLGDPLAKSVLDNRGLLEGLERCLDREHRHGIVKCWKHLADHFKVDSEIYEGFTCSHENSPTEDLFELLKTQTPAEFTIDQLKNKLNSIDRPDVIQEVLLKHQQLDSQLTDETRVESLFESHPKVIGEMTFMLDKETPGKNNWRKLADAFGVPRSKSEGFGDSIDDDSTMDFLEYLRAKRPDLTIGYLKRLLEDDLKLQAAVDVIVKSKKVNDDSHLEKLWDDLDTLATLCSLLAKKHTNKIRRWRYLGNKLDVKKEILDSISPTKGEFISPTEVLIYHLGATKPSLTMKDLILALETIDKSDALAVLKDYFPDGCILKLLAPVRASRHSGKHQLKTTSSTYNETAI